MPFYYYFDSTMMLIIPALLFTLYAQFKVNSAFQKYGKIYSSSGYSGESIAKMILANAGINDVRIEATGKNNYGDHYSPNEKVIRLSANVYNSNSVAALGIAAHECGHAIQHHNGYVPNAIRSAIVPIANIGSSFSIPLFFLGLIFTSSGLQLAGIILFSLSTLFFLVTLPVEINASRRAIKILNNTINSQELAGVKNVLSAAALTYLAAALMSIMQLLRLVALSRRD